MSSASSVSKPAETCDTALRERSMRSKTRRCALRDQACADNSVSAGLISSFQRDFSQFVDVRYQSIRHCSIDLTSTSLETSTDILSPGWTCTFLPVTK